MFDGAGHRFVDGPVFSGDSVLKLLTLLLLSVAVPLVLFIGTAGVLALVSFEEVS